MKSIFDLDNSARAYWSAEMRDRLGLSDTSSATWAKYRKLAGVPSQEKSLTQREVFLLWVISKASRQRGLTRVAVIKAANLILNSDGFEVAADLPASQLSAEQARILVGKRLGLSGPVSERTLYRWAQSPGIPPYSRRSAYSQWQIQRWIAHGEKLTA